MNVSNNLRKKCICVPEHWNIVFFINIQIRYFQLSFINMPRYYNQPTAMHVEIILLVLCSFGLTQKICNDLEKQLSFAYLFTI